ncbi:MAG: hypothetical protein AB7Q29_12695 [Vicinamibacterales bacterium]
MSVVLFDRQLAQLDTLGNGSSAIRRRTLNRAEIIRALIDGLLDSGLDVSAATSEADLRAKVARRLGTPFR